MELQVDILFIDLNWIGFAKLYSEKQFDCITLKSLSSLYLRVSNFLCKGLRRQRFLALAELW